VAISGPALPPGRPLVLQGEVLSLAEPMNSSCTSTKGVLSGCKISMQT
jgi:hypothetical protein